MYQNKLVASIEVKGRILRESGDTVALPFGSEYIIRIKNLNSIRALVRVSIDGQHSSDISDGWFIVQPNSTLRLERFIKNGNMSSGNRFKFIERTEAVENYRGIKEDDGLIRIEYKFEKIYNYNYTVYNEWPKRNPFYNWDDLYKNAQFTKSDNVYNGGHTVTCNSFGPVRGGIRGSSSGSINACYSAPVNKAGITAPGSYSDQKFSYGSWFATEDKTDVIVLHLVGEIAQKPVEQPVYVNSLTKCPTCGKMNKSSHTFCSKCGTCVKMF